MTDIAKNRDDVSTDLCPQLTIAARMVAKSMHEPLYVAGLLAFAADHIADLQLSIENLRAHVGKVAPPEDDGEEVPAAKPARALAGDHRHKFDDAGKCTVTGCKHTKSARGRKAAPAAAPPANGAPASGVLAGVIEPGYVAPVPQPIGDE